jgi:VWFA-related protein
MQSSFWRRSPAWLCVAGLLASSFAETPSPSPPQAEPTLRVTTRLVEVSVIVQDRAGEPATDLTRDDFVVLDAGREQSISVFAKESAAAPRAPSSPLPANTFSNRLEQTEAAPTSATVILLDGLNTRLADQPYARQQIVEFLEQLQPQDCVALYALGQGLRVVHDFTREPRPLLAALAREGARLSPALLESEAEEPGTGWSEFDAWMGEVNRNVAERYRADRALRTIRSLLAIANHLERLPGRKNLIWVAGSFAAWFNRPALATGEKLKLESGNFSVEIERAARALNNANVAIYPVDARGLVAPAEFSPERASISRELPGASHGDVGSMLELAERTGGRAFYHRNDIRRALRRAVDDARLTYVLGYYPSHGKWNGEFRALQVRVKRPGLQVRHRRGYFALPDEPGDEAHRRAVLDAAMWSPIDASRLGLTVRALPAGNALELELAIDLRDLALRQQDGQWMGTLDLMLVQLSADARNLKGVSHVVNLQLNPETYRVARGRQAVVLTERLGIVSGATLLRILARDASSGALGSVSIPLARLSPGRQP